MYIAPVVCYIWSSIHVLRLAITDLVKCSEASATPIGISSSQPIWIRLSSTWKRQFVPTCVRRPSISGVTNTMHRKNLEVQTSSTGIFILSVWIETTPSCLKQSWKGTSVIVHSRYITSSLLQVRSSHDWESGIPPTTGTSKRRNELMARTMMGCCYGYTDIFPFFPLSFLVSITFLIYFRLLSFKPRHYKATDIFLHFSTLLPIVTLGTRSEHVPNFLFRQVVSKALCSA